MPNWPTGVQTATIVFGRGVTIGGNMTSSTLTVQPLFSGTNAIVWAAEGTPLLPFSESATAEDGSYGTVTLPVVDQPGWLDDGQHPFTLWGYRLTEVPRYGPRMGDARVKYVQPLLGQTSIDFDLIPDGSIGLPSSGPVAAVTSFLGKTGAVTATDLTAAGVPTAASLAATYLTYDGTHILKDGTVVPVAGGTAATLARDSAGGLLLTVGS